MTTQTNTNTTAPSFIGFFEILTLIFITLKLVGVIGWSWWWVLSPMLVQAGALVVLLIIAFIIVLSKEFK